MHDFISGSMHGHLPDGIWNEVGSPSLRAALRRAPAKGCTIGFAPGTSVATTNGPCAIEHLRVGHHLQTRDHGILPVLWAGALRQRFPGPQVLFELAENTLGLHGAIQCAPRQTVLVSGDKALTQFAKNEALVEVRGLHRMYDVSRNKDAHGACYHVLLARPALFLANGLWVDGLHPADLPDQGLAEETLQTLQVAFAKHQDGPKALTVIRGPEARALVDQKMAEDNRF